MFWLKAKGFEDKTLGLGVGDGIQTYMEYVNDSLRLANMGFDSCRLEFELFMGAKLGGGKFDMELGFKYLYTPRTTNLRVMRLTAKTMGQEVVYRLGNKGIRALPTLKEVFRDVQHKTQVSVISHLVRNMEKGAGRNDEKRRLQLETKCKQLFKTKMK